MRYLKKKFLFFLSTFDHLGFYLFNKEKLVFLNHVTSYTFNFIFITKQVIVIVYCSELIFFLTQHQENIFYNMTKFSLLYIMITPEINFCNQFLFKYVKSNFLQNFR